MNNTRETLYELLMGDNVVERIRGEYDNGLFHNLFKGIDVDIDKFIMDQRNANHCYSILMHCAHTVDSCRKHFPLRVAALFHDIGKIKTFQLIDGVGRYFSHDVASEEIVREFLTRANFETEESTLIRNLIRWHMSKTRHTERSVRRLVNRMDGIENTDLLLELMEADLKSHRNPSIDKLDELKELFRTHKIAG